MNAFCTTIFVLIVIITVVVYRKAIIWAIDYIFLPKKKRDFVNKNEKLLGRKFSKRFWDKYNP